MRTSMPPLILLLAACSSKSEPAGNPTSAHSATDGDVRGGSDPNAQEYLEDEDAPAFAEITAVAIHGEPGAYTFSVTVRSPDTGCDQYADWWEVVDSGTDELLYRRILTHSHVDEQPFTRSGGPVDLRPDTQVFVRAHMNTSGYGPSVVGIAPAGTFERIDLGSDYAADLASRPPLPDGCDF